MLGEAPTFGITGSFDIPEKLFNTKFCLSCHYNDANSYLFVNGE